MRMPPRPRKHSKKGWPDNLYKTQRRPGYFTYKYKHPVTGKFHGMGSNEGEAIKAARLLNSQLMSVTPEAQLLINKVMGVKKTFGDHLDWYRDTALAERRNRRGQPLSDNTLKEYHRYIEVYRDKWGNRDTRDITHGMVTTFLNEHPPATSNKYRALLGNVFQYAMAEGLIDGNPIDATIKRTESKKRERLPFAWYQKIYQAAAEAGDQWFCNALDLARYSLQRREDIVNMKFEHQHGDALQVIQEKTGKALAIKGLGWLVTQCRDGLLSPYLVHRKPDRMRRADVKSKGHYTQVTPNYLSHTFKYYRDEVLGLCNHLAPEQRPSFHEIRALGADLYRQAGKEDEGIKGLLGHESQLMTDKYLDGHGVRFEVVYAGSQNE